MATSLLPEEKNIYTLLENSNLDAVEEKNLRSILQDCTITARLINILLKISSIQSPAIGVPGHASVIVPCNNNLAIETQTVYFIDEWTGFVEPVCLPDYYKQQGDLLVLKDPMPQEDVARIRRNFRCLSNMNGITYEQRRKKP